MSNAATAMPRRTGKYYVIIGLAVIGTFFFARQTHQAVREIQDPLGTSTEDSDAESCAIPSGGSEHAIDEFVKGFPKLRGKGDLGQPEARRDEERVIFDWPRTTKMIVL